MIGTAASSTIPAVNDTAPTWVKDRRIIFVGFGDIVRSRGARSYLTSFLRALEHHGAHLEAVFYQQDVADGETLSVLPISVVRSPLSGFTSLPVVIRRLWELLWALWGAARRLRGLDADAVVLLTGAPLLVLAPLLRRSARQRFYLMHGVAEESLLVATRRARIRYRVAKLLERLTLRHFTAVVVVSHAMSRYCSLEYGVERFVLAPCGVDLARFRRAASQREHIRAALGLQGRSVLVYSGSADISHCASQTVEAYALARRIIPNAFLLVLSYEPDVFDALLRQIGGTDWKVLSVTPEEVPAYLAAGDAGFMLLVNRPTIWVSCPVKFAEYVASGLPVIAPPFVGDYSEVIRMDRIGVMLDPDDSGTWVPAFTALRSLIGDPDVRTRCLHIAESLSWDRLPARFEGSVP